MLRPSILTKARPLHDKKSYASSIPFGCLLVHPVCNIVDIIRSKFLTKSRHRVFTVGDLGFDSINIVTSEQVLFELLLHDFFLGDDTVVATGMASSTIGAENGLTIFQV